MDQFFDISSHWRVAICRQCQYAVWPSSVAGHLKGGHHRLPTKEALRTRREAPIMSHVIKMARFMIIQMAYQQVDEDHEYAEEEEPDLLALVTGMVDKCMIRGSQGAMQWIFDRPCIWDEDPLYQHIARQRRLGGRSNSIQTDRVQYAPVANYDSWIGLRDISSIGKGVIRVGTRFPPDAR